MKNFKKTYLKDEYIFLFLGAMIVAVGAFGFSEYSFKKVVKENAEDTFDENIPFLCENGDWIEYPDLENSNQYEKFIGQEKFKYDEEKNVFVSADDKRNFSTDKDYSLFFFIDRDTQVEGYKVREDEIFVRRIKCAGIEADEDVLLGRRKLMNYIRDNINALALEKAPGDNWQVGTFYFATDTDLYVQYETEGSFMEEAPYDSHLWLIRVSDPDKDIPTIRTLAYIQEDAEDSSKNILKQGEDLYRDAKNMTIYEFDDEVNQWVLQ
ncbi:MAG TPA: hypothetical protein DIC35_02205 [Candidatus Moranbacteria bacterium]|nr:hypothetical protein [Candidatus Moranbacteria bacterium]